MYFELQLHNIFLFLLDTSIHNNVTGILFEISNEKMENIRCKGLSHSDFLYLGYDLHFSKQNSI